MTATVGVSIQALAECHIPQVVAACGDWQELAQFGPPYWRPRSEAELRRKIASTAGPDPATEYSFVLVETGGVPVGECSVHAIDWRNRVAQIGVCIWRPADRRLGVGAVALEAMTEYAFGYLGLARVEGWIMADNAPSLALVKAAGWQREGTLRRRYLHGGRWSDVVIMALLASERCLSASATDASRA